MLNMPHSINSNRTIAEFQNAIHMGLIADLQNRMSARQEGYLKARQYYDGVQETQLTDRLRQFLNIRQDVDFNANYCPVVVNAKADRLKVTGFETKNQALNDKLWDWWRRNRMDKKQGIIHRSAVRDGDSYLLIEWDAKTGIPRFHHEPAWAGDGMMAVYSTEHRDEIAFAVKQWRIDMGNGRSCVRRNLYLPNQIEKYIAWNDGDTNWHPYISEGETPDLIGDGMLGKAAIHPWVDRNGEPLGVPVVHYKENDNGDGFGTSHLNNVMPLQDVVNKALIDLIGAMDTEGFGLLVGYGTDAWSQVKVGPGAIAAVSTTPDKAKLERLPATNPAGLLQVYNAWVMEIARVSNTPMSYFQISGQVSAEGTLKQQEIGLLAGAKKAQTDFGNCYEDAMVIARRLHNAFSDEAELDEDALIDTLWQDAEIRNDKEVVDTLAIKVEKLGVPQEQAWIELNYDAEAQAKFKRAKLQAQADATRNQMKLAQAQGGVANQAQAARQNMTQTENMNEAPPL